MSVVHQNYYLTSKKRREGLLLYIHYPLLSLALKAFRIPSHNTEWGDVWDSPTLFLLIAPD